MLPTELSSLADAPHPPAARAAFAAACEALAERQINASPTSLFAALMNTVEAAMIQGVHAACVDEDEGAAPTLAGPLYALSRTLPHVPPSVVQRKADVAVKLFADVLGAASEAPQSVARPAMDCAGSVISTLLAHGGGPIDALIGKIFPRLLTYTVDARPKVRRKAHDAAASALRAAQAGGKATRKARDSMARTVCQVCDRLVDESTKKRATSTLHYVNFLKLALPLLPPKNVLSAVDAELSLLPKADPMLVLCIVQSLESVLGAPLGSTPSTSLRQILEALQSIQLADRHRSQSVAVCNLMSLAARVLVAQDGESALPHAVRVAHELADRIPADDVESARIIAAAMGDLFRQTLSGPILERAARGMRERLREQRPLRESPPEVERMISVGVSLLHARYQPVWDATLVAVDGLIRACGQHGHPLLHGLITALSKFFEPPLDQVVGPMRSRFASLMASVIRSIGAEATLDILPLGLDAVLRRDADAHPRAWLLPLLAQHTPPRQRIAYYWDMLLPIADALRDAGAAEDSDEGGAAAVVRKQMRVLADQLYDLLPVFFRAPSDLATSFPQHAEAMGTRFANDPPMRARIAAALVAAVRSVVVIDSALLPDDDADDDDVATNVPDSDPAPTEDDAVTSRTGTQRTESTQAPKAASGALSLQERSEGQAALAGFAQNFFPLLFNALGDAEGKERAAILVAIAAYARAAEQRVVDAFFVDVIKKLLRAVVVVDPSQQEAMDASAREAQRATKHNMADLVLALTPALSPSSADVLLRALTPQLHDDEDASLAKKAYLALARALARNAAFAGARANSIFQTLTDATAACPPAARRARFQCIRAVLAAASLESLDMALPLLMGELMLGLKEPSKRTRAEAYRTLIFAARRYVGTDGIAAESGEHVPLRAGRSAEDIRERAGRVVQMALAGIAGTTPHMISAAVMALTRLAYEFRHHVMVVDDAMVETATALLQHPAREVVKPTLTLCKIVVGALDPDTLTQRLDQLVPALMGWSRERFNRFRLQVRTIVARLVRKCGEEPVAAACPEDDRPLIASIRRESERARREREQRRAGPSAHSGNRAESKTGGRFAGAKTDESDSDDSMFDKDGESDDALSDGDLDMDVGSGGAVRLAARRRGAARPQRSLREDADLLAGDAASEAASSGGTRLKRKRSRGADAEIDEHGRLVVHDDEDPHRRGASARGKREKEQGDDASARQGKERGGKRARVGKGDGDGKRDFYSGHEYKARKEGAYGDMRKPGKLEPFAYVPLDRASLNKRKRAAGAAEAAAVAKGSHRKGRGQTLSRAQRRARQKHAGAGRRR